MTYFGFLATFVVFPILVLGIFQIWNKKKDKSRSYTNSKIVVAIGAHMFLALLYTTPWDNYLVVTRVWYYEPRLVSGIVLGYVPLEEYTFFLLQTLLVGLWWQVLAHRIPPPRDFKPSQRLRLLSSIIAILIWLCALIVSLSHWKLMTYLSIILFWSIPPIIPQLVFGADILWHQRKLLMWTILPLGLYLSFTDTLAIASGTWTINPAQSTGIFIGQLPLEEAVFFFVTVTMVSFGITLLLSEDSSLRWLEIKRTFKRLTARMSNI